MRNRECKFEIREQKVQPLRVLTQRDPQSYTWLLIKFLFFIKHPLTF